ncbi:hypothetical protein [Roseomonas sp. CECT 9278]|uniref:hypothetical protein n=1 Tax=Roseomonas sp. CECT 9278 TaxID=2845823 RepID=UPI001E543525|nr:hypothetical protein [Roseomonas sp. CECT 9278]
MPPDRGHEIDRFPGWSAGRGAGGPVTAAGGATSRDAGAVPPPPIDMPDGAGPLATRDGRAGARP